MRSMSPRLFGAFFASRYYLSRLCHLQGVIRQLMLANDERSSYEAFCDLGANLTEQEAEDRLLADSLHTVYFPTTDAELVAFATEAASTNL
jgi:hypothetical protein